MFCLDGACDTNSFWQSLKILCHRQTSTRTNRKCWFPDHMKDIKRSESESFPHKYNSWWLNQDDWIYLLSHITFTFHFSFHFYFPSHFYITYSCGQLSQVAVFKSALFLRRACINETTEKVFCPNPAWPSWVWTPSWAETPEAAAVTDYSVFRPGAERGPHHTPPHTRRQKAIHSHSWMETFRGLKTRMEGMILNTRVKDLGDEKVSVLTAI